MKRKKGCRDEGILLLMLFDLRELKRFFIKKTERDELVFT